MEADPVPLARVILPNVNDFPSDTLAELTEPVPVNVNDSDVTKFPIFVIIEP